MKPLKAWIKREPGFTLIEMSLVLFIISALLLLFVPNLAGRQESASNTGDEAIMAVLQSQADMYTMDQGDAPASFEVMKNGNYLTDKQLKEAEDNFVITGGEVSVKTEIPDEG